MMKDLAIRGPWFCRLRLSLSIFIVYTDISCWGCQIDIQCRTQSAWTQLWIFAIIKFFKRPLQALLVLTAWLPSFALMVRLYQNPSSDKPMQALFLSGSKLLDYAAEYSIDNRVAGIRQGACLRHALDTVVVRPCLAHQDFIFFLSAGCAWR